MDKRIMIAASVAITLTGCVVEDENNATENVATNNATTNNATTNNATTNNATTNNATTNNATTNNATTNNGTDGWSTSTHPCAGNRTDALWCDDAQTCFVGCGTTTTGVGLFTTTDGGQNWSALTTTPADFFAAARVNSISRSEGTLYVAGDLPNSAAVVSVDDSGAVAEVFTRGATVDFSFTPGNFRRAMNGRAIAESLTGVDLVYREMDGGDPTDSWSTGRGFWSDGDPDDVPNGLQILDLEVYDGQFYGAGANINQPPTVFLPAWDQSEFDFQIVRLATGIGEFDGEMWGIDVNADGISVGGVDQNRDVGKVYSIATAEDATDAANWTEFDVASVLADEATWVTDVCRASGNVVIATGRQSAEGWGFVLRSEDGGETFTDITPYDESGNSEFEDVSRCQVVDNGIIVAGKDGLFARYF